MKTELRAKMMQYMALRNFSKGTVRNYIGEVKRLAKHYMIPPDQLTHQQILDYLEHLKTVRGLSTSTCNVTRGALRCLYVDVLKRPAAQFELPPQRREQRLPDVLNTREVEALLAAVGNPKHRALLMTIYGAGLRVSEAVAVRVEDIDGVRMMIHVRQGKRHKDRYTILPARLRAELRGYWALERPQTWLFPGADPGRPLTTNSVREIYREAKAKAGIAKRGGVHALRHSFATHHLENGTDLATLQKLLGHGRIETTARYVRITEERVAQTASPLDRMTLPSPARVEEGGERHE